MGIILLLIALIILTVIWIIGQVLYSFLGAPGIILPILLIALIAAVVHTIGLPIVIGAIIIIALIRKTANVISDIRTERRWKSSFGTYSCSPEPPLCSGSFQDDRDICYRRNISDTPKTKMRPVTNNCPNCGGLMTGGVCPYCNTEWYIG